MLTTDTMTHRFTLRKKSKIYRSLFVSFSVSLSLSFSHSVSPFDSVLGRRLLKVLSGFPRPVRPRLTSPPRRTRTHLYERPYLPDRPFIITGRAVVENPVGLRSFLCVGENVFGVKKRRETEGRVGQGRLTGRAGRNGLGDGPQ